MNYGASKLIQTPTHTRARTHTRAPHPAPPPPHTHRARQFTPIYNHMLSWKQAFGPAPASDTMLQIRAVLE
jgi:hypothetical protein